MLDYINPFSENFILKGVLEALQVLNPLSEDFILKGVIEFLGNIISYLNPFHENFFGRKLVELFGDLLTKLFVPNEQKIFDLQNVFTEKLAFVESIKTAVNSMKNMFENLTSLPKFTMNIDCPPYYSGELTIIDLAWYAPYKPYGDLVITGFAYFFFIWRLWCSVPNILHGSGKAVDIISGVGVKK